MKIICVGLGRTGTMSILFAFESLGYTVLHYTKLIESPKELRKSRFTTWVQAFQAKLAGDKELTKHYLKVALSEYDVTCDWPACVFWEEMAELYPDAYFILTHRDTADVWATSVINSIANMTLMNEHWYYGIFKYHPMRYYPSKIQIYFMQTYHDVKDTLFFGH